LGFSTHPAAVAVEPIEPLANPYRGLRAFQETDAAHFFGRDAAVGSLLERLAETDVPNRFLAIVGPSGSGKSSLIKAGLLPALRAGALPGSENWYVVELPPGPQLAQDLALAQLGIAAEGPPDLAAILASGEQGLAQAVERVLPLSLIANAQQAMDDRDTATALVLALAANQIADPPPEVQRMLLDVAYAPEARQRYEVSEMFPGLQGPATALALNPEGQELIIGLADGSIVLWNWSTGQEIRRLQGHSAPVMRN
jgi:energy-coupling factor transporter ATP-binding protein EcfA2